MIKALKEPASEIVSINDHVKSSEIQELSENIRAFEYCLSDKGAKAKLLKAARRANTMEIEENSTSSNLNFSAGAWHTVVLPSISYWNEVKGNDSCKVGEYTIRIGGISTGTEGNGKQVDNKIVFLADRDKIVCHLYNTTCRILVNGHGYKKFMDLFLIPFFKSKITLNTEETDKYNDLILEKLSTRTVKRSNVT